MLFVLLQQGAKRNRKHLLRSLRRAFEWRYMKAIVPFAASLYKWLFSMSIVVILCSLPFMALVREYYRNALLQSSAPQGEVYNTLHRSSGMINGDERDLRIYAESDASGPYLHLLVLEMIILTPAIALFPFFLHRTFSFQSKISQFYCSYMAGILSLLMSFTSIWYPDILNLGWSLVRLDGFGFFIPLYLITSSFPWKEVEALNGKSFTKKTRRKFRWILFAFVVLIHVFTFFFHVVLPGVALYRGSGSRILVRLLFTPFLEMCCFMAVKGLLTHLPSFFLADYAVFLFVFFIKDSHASGRIFLSLSKATSSSTALESGVLFIGVFFMEALVRVLALGNIITMSRPLDVQNAISPPRNPNDHSHPPIGDTAESLYRVRSVTWVPQPGTGKESDGEEVWPTASPDSTQYPVPVRKALRSFPKLPAPNSVSVSGDLENRSSPPALSHSRATPGERTLPPPPRVSSGKVADQEMMEVSHQGGLSDQVSGSDGKALTGGKIVPVFLVPTPREIVDFLQDPKSPIFAPWAPAGVDGFIGMVLSQGLLLEMMSEVCAVWYGEVGTALIIEDGVGLDYVALILQLLGEFFVFCLCFRVATLVGVNLVAVSRTLPVFLLLFLAFYFTSGYSFSFHSIFADITCFFYGDSGAPVFTAGDVCRVIAPDLGGAN